MHSLINKIETYKTEKIRIPSQKSQSISQPIKLDTQKSLTENSNSNPNPNPEVSRDISSLPNIESKDSKESQIQSSSEIPEKSVSQPTLSKALSIDYKSILSNSRSAIPIKDDNLLLEVEVAVPHLVKQQSQTIADNTLFINYIMRQNSIVDKQSIKARLNQDDRKFKDLRSLAAQLAHKHKEKRSQNLTLEMIQSRFQATDLNHLDEKSRKKKVLNFDKKIIPFSDEEDDDDSDFNPEEAKKEEEREKPTQSNEEVTPTPNPTLEEGAFEEPIVKSPPKENSAPKKNSSEKKRIDIEDIWRLEEGYEEEENEEAEEYDGEEEGEDADGEEEYGEEEEAEEGEQPASQENKQSPNKDDPYGLEQFNDISLHNDDEDEKEHSAECKTF
mgnify:CR=1 FL=1